MPVAHRTPATSGGTWAGLAHLLVILATVARGFGQESLFAGSPDILEFSPDQLNATILSDSRAWVVDYYAHWCPHCVHYAPKFRNIAAELREESRVKFAALDCAQFLDFCGGISVMGFPTIRVYHFDGLLNSDKREGANVEPQTLIFEDRDFVRWIRAKLSVLPPAPGLNMLAGAAPGTAETASDIAERLRASMTAAVAAAAGDAVHAAAMDQAAKQAVSASLASPGLAEAGSGSSTASVASSRVDHVSVSGADAAALRLVDAEIAILSSLWQGAFLEAEAGQHLKGRPLHELMAWLDFLALVMPGAAGEDTAKLAVAARKAANLAPASGLDTSMLISSGATTSEAVLERSAWTQILQSHGLDRAPPQAGQHPEAYFRLCRTYTCGLWTLFHLVMVSVAEQQTGAGLLSPTGFLARGAGYLSGHPTPEDALERIRGFVEHFFGCLDCRAHFLRSYDGCDLGRCHLPRGDSEAAALWLWRMHNDVTLRVAAENGAKQPSPWPSQEACPDCWPLGAGPAQATQGDSVAIYNHLRSEYWIPEWGGPSSTLKARLRKAPRGPTMLGGCVLLVFLAFGLLRLRCCSALSFDRVKGS